MKVLPLVTLHIKENVNKKCISIANNILSVDMTSIYIEERINGF